MNKIKILTMLLPTLLLGMNIKVDVKNATNVKILEESSSMSKIEVEYNDFINNLRNFPTNFVYDNHYFKGFSPQYFKVVSRNIHNERNGIITTIILNYEELEVKIVSGLYKDYDAYDYTVYFKNTSNHNSKVLKQFNNIDINFKGNNPVLKGILGDHENNYKPYERDLSSENVHFRNETGRATHITFPYFNLENDDGGVLLAVGWGGTWEADFKYDSFTQETNFKATSTIDMKTYLKPGEQIRSALIGVVRYYERNEDEATNKWRRWFIDCNMPREAGSDTLSVQPHTSVFLALDSDRPNSDGSIAEYSEMWKPSLETFYKHGLKADFRWFDAGWYYDPYNKTVPSDWWGTVGTWELDAEKWPGDTFKESVDYAREHGTRTFVWFESERVTHLDGMVKNYGYNRAWVLSDHGNNNCYINNLGNPDCLKWTTNRILAFFKKTGIDMYREDFNMDPQIFWTIGDGYEGHDRVGITENKYMQGHWQLWDNIIEYCKNHGGCPYVDSCASGGGRNDLETVRRSVPFLRSDADRTTIPLRLSFTYSLSKWLPYSGVPSNESGSQLTQGDTGLYSSRASYMAHTYFNVRWKTDEKIIPWDTLLQVQREYDEIKGYLLKDYYSLTPYTGINNDKAWSSYMFVDKENNKAVVQAFRQEHCADDQIKVQLKGLNKDTYYSVRDIDGVNSLARVKGSALMKGFIINAGSPRTAVIIYIDPIS